MGRQKSWKMTETLGYPSESAQWELSNEYQHDRVKMVFKILCLLCFGRKSPQHWRVKNKALDSKHFWRRVVGWFLSTISHSNILIMTKIFPMQPGHLSPYAAGGWFHQYRMMLKTLKTTGTLAHGYSSESTKRKLSNEYQHDRV